MNKIKYPIAVAAFTLLAATSASAANYVYGNTVNDGNQTMNDSRNWFEVSSFEGLTGYEGLTRLSETNTKLAPTASDNLLVKNFNMSDLIGEYYQPADALLSDSGSVYNMRSQSFGFQANPSGANLFEVGNLTFSVDQNYVLNTSPRTAAQNSNVDNNFHWRPQGIDGNVKIHGTLTLEKSSKLTIQGDSAAAGTWNTIDIGQLVISTSGAGAKSQLNLGNRIKEIRIGVQDNGSGTLVANGQTSTLSNGSGMYFNMDMGFNGGANSQVYIGNFTTDAGSDLHIKGGDFHFLGETHFNGNVVVLHTPGLSFSGNITKGAGSGMDFRLGHYTGTFTNNGTLNMTNIENPTAALSFTGALINSGTFNFGKGTFNGTIENTGTINLERTGHAEAHLIPVAVMTANVVNRKTFTAKDDVKFKGSFRAIGKNSVSTFKGTSTADLSNATLRMENALVSVSESAKMLILNTTLVYDFESSAAFNPILEFATIANIDSLSDIFATDFSFMNIDEGTYDLIRFLDTNMYSSLQDIIDAGGTYNFKDWSTYHLYEGTFIESEDGVFAITFVLIPEPSTYAAIFGLLALALAVYRRRK